MKNSEQPINARTAFDQNGYITSFEEEFLGLTKREYFAGLALQSLISNSSIVKKIDTNNGEDLPLLSITSIAIADELLKQLEL